MGKVLINLKSAREKAKFTQEQLAHIAGVSVSTIAKAEKGRGVTLSTMKHIAKGLKVKPEELI